MKRFRAAFISLAVLTNIGIGVVSAVAQTNKVEPATRCTTETLKGSFAFEGQGFGAQVPAAFIGVLHFDGKGQFSGRHEESIGGNYGPSIEAGDYFINDDCMGETRWTDHPPHTGLPPHNHTLALVVYSGGDAGHFLSIDMSPPGEFHREIPDPNVVFWGTFRRL